MRLRAILILGLGLALGLAAVVLVRTWLASQLANVPVASVPAPLAPAPTATIVVATTSLHLGDLLTPANIKTIAWPADALPPGAFKSVQDLTGPQPRLVLMPIEPNEPVLASKISGPGGRATLSAIIDKGKSGLTIRVNDVLGVAGFVLPGDHVDVFLTREPAKDEGPVTDVLMQDVKVLGVDQVADQKTQNPMVVKAVTFEVTTEQAQKLTLASQVGTLSLALRGAATQELEAVRRIAVSDLPGGLPTLPKPDVPMPAPEHFVHLAPPPTVGITRGLERSVYRIGPNGQVLPDQVEVMAPPILPPEPVPVAAPAPPPAPGGGVPGAAPPVGTAPAKGGVPTSNQGPAATGLKPAAATAS
jgi:pilus assembly protein CpaB